MELLIKVVLAEDALRADDMNIPIGEDMVEYFPMNIKLDKIVYIWRDVDNNEMHVGANGEDILVLYNEKQYKIIVRNIEKTE